MALGATTKRPMASGLGAFAFELYRRGLFAVKSDEDPDVLMCVFCARKGLLQTDGPFQIHHGEHCLVRRLAPFMKNKNRRHRRMKAYLGKRGLPPNIGQS